MLAEWKMNWKIGRVEPNRPVMWLLQRIWDMDLNTINMLKAPKFNSSTRSLF